MMPRFALPTKPLRMKKIIETRPLMVLNPYKQLSSPFVIGNNDRFGQSTQSLLQGRMGLGPGAYDDDRINTTQTPESS